MKYAVKTLLLYLTIAISMPVWGDEMKENRPPTISYTGEINSYPDIEEINIPIDFGDGNTQIFKLKNVSAYDSVVLSNYQPIEIDIPCERKFIKPGTKLALYISDACLAEITLPEGWIETNPTPDTQ